MNADPRRPEKVQRYVPKTSNGTGQEDLTPDYMNILGQHQTTANVVEASDKHAETSVGAEPNLQAAGHLVEDAQLVVADELAVTANATNVIPTSPQYGVAIIPNAAAVAAAITAAPNDIPTETYTPPTETVTDTTAKPPDEGKDLHSTPSRNDRFKVVKIASLEPFKRGRWKCMDYIAGGPYMQTQSLPQQQIQQMLLQSGFANGTQVFSGVPGAQMIPQGQYFYPQMANMPSQTLQQPVPSTMPAQFIGGQPYFAAGGAAFQVPQSYPVQYIPANLMHNQNSAFVPTSQMPSSFQQSQTYAGQQSQSGVVQPVVNGHNFTPQNEQVTGSLPTQTAKSVILNSNVSQPVVSQSQQMQPGMQNHMPVQANQSVQQYQQGVYQQTAQSQALQQAQPFDQGLPSNIYTNPQFPMNVNSLTALDGGEMASEVNETSSGVDAASENADDPAKTNPVVNAIDNKIEQAMDLVKSHLMYTVREEVEVLKEKIAELMERIQQLETENNFLRSQIPKSQAVASTPASNPAPTQTTTIPTNPSPSFNPSSGVNAPAPAPAPAPAAAGTAVTTPQTGTPIANPSHNPVPSAQTHSLPSGDAINAQQ
ncbi:hypothetical protein NQ318_018804 [Aromia moschata]|uniref:Protein Asterix n=1 Tax=Aromia moschata TaxID=1265417 RepID=A0AAV8ZHU8_9CUCU|nr:hypothetical protein NQ318_018804 [Aromia moschata]